MYKSFFQAHLYSNTQMASVWNLSDEVHKSVLSDENQECRSYFQAL